MEITWYGHSCFRMMERGTAAIVADPFDEGIGYEVPTRLRGDIVTISHDTPNHNAVQHVKGEFMVLERPGEYEIGGVFITGIATYNARKNPENTHYNVTYVYDFNRFNICHLGDLDHVLNQSQVEALGEIHVLMVPVGGGIALNSSQAAEVISLIEPNYVIPMHYATPDGTLELEPLDKFLKEMGVTDYDEVETLKLTSSGLPEETQVVVMQQKQ